MNESGSGHFCPVLSYRLFDVKKRATGALFKKMRWKPFLLAAFVFYKCGQSITGSLWLYRFIRQTCHAGASIRGVVVR